MFFREEQDRARIPQIDLHARLDFQFVREFGIQAGARHRQGLKSWQRIEGAVDQHAAGSVGGFAARLSALDDQNAGSAFAQCNREREADDASADDDYVPSLHVGIVKDARGARGVLE